MQKYTYSTKSQSNVSLSFRCLILFKWPLDWRDIYSSLVYDFQTHDPRRSYLIDGNYCEEIFYFHLWTGKTTERGLIGEIRC